MTPGAAQHRTSAEANGPPIDCRIDALRRAQDAERGSDLLYSSLRLQFRHFALKHGVTMKDAQLFCMNAEEPR